MNKTFIIAAVLMAAALTGTLSTNSVAFAQDEFETNAQQVYIGGGESTNSNCSIGQVSSLEVGSPTELDGATVECDTTVPLE
jgi:hypothetical protein